MLSLKEIATILEGDSHNWPNRPKDQGPTHIKSIRELEPNKNFVLHVIRRSTEKEVRFKILPNIETIRLSDRAIIVLDMDRESRSTRLRLPYMGLIPYEAGELFLRRPMEIRYIDGRVVTVERTQIDHKWSANWVEDPTLDI